MLAEGLLSFPKFCGLLSVQPKEGGGRIRMVLTPIQRSYNAARTSRDIILKPRQVYMTTLEAARDLWWFLTKRGARVVVVCQSSTDMGPLKDIAEKFRLYFDSLARLGLKLDFGRRSATEWSIPHRDATMRIIQSGASEASASKKGRGGTVNRLHITEAAFFERAEDTFNSLMESVPKEGSEVVNESTPNGAAGFYYEQWSAAVRGDSGYRPHFFRWWDHPDYRIPIHSGETFEAGNEFERSLLSKGVAPENIRWYRWKLADKGGNVDLVKQEFPSDPETCFLVSGRQFFNASRTLQLLDAAQEPIETVDIRDAGARGQLVGRVEVPALRIWHHKSPGASYVLSLDTSEGGGGDASSGIVYERGTGRHMATLWGQFKPWELARAAVGVAHRYSGALIVVERNNHGHACLRALEAEMHYPRIFFDRDEKPGWLNVETTRTAALDTLEQAHRGSHFATLDRFLLSEMRTFVITERGKAEAAKGSHDDLVMAAAIGWDVICRANTNYDLTNLPPR